MGATASINATSKKYKPTEPIEVKFHNVVKYDDGEEKTFKNNYQLETKKPQPLSLLACAIKILERKPKDHPPPNGYLPQKYSRQVRPRSAYMVMKKGSQSSSTLSTTDQNGSLPNGIHPNVTLHQKQLKTKQDLYMSLINPSKAALNDARLASKGMTVPQRIRPTSDVLPNYGLPKAHTLPRYNGDNGKRLRVNRRLYMDMIRPVMASPQYLKLGGSRSTPATPLSQRTLSRQSNSHPSLPPRPPNERRALQRLHPNMHQIVTRDLYTPQREIYVPQGRTPTPQQRARSDLGSSTSNGLLPHKDIHLPKLTRKTKDGVSLNSSLNSRSSGEIPRGHPDNITPLYFRKSLAYSPQYKHKELLSNPL